VSSETASDKPKSASGAGSIFKCERQLQVHRLFDIWTQSQWNRTQDLKEQNKFLSFTRSFAYLPTHDQTDACARISHKRWCRHYPLFPSLSYPRQTRQKLHASREKHQPSRTPNPFLLVISKQPKLTRTGHESTNTSYLGAGVSC
jgi:hypothetical protein